MRRLREPLQRDGVKHRVKNPNLRLQGSDRPFKEKRPPDGAVPWLPRLCLLASVRPPPRWSRGTGDGGELPLICNDVESL